MPAAMMTVAAGMATGPGSRVTRFAKSTAASVTPVRPGKTHALSPLDNAMERHTVHVVLYLRAAPGGLDREQLKESLSEVLSLYPAMTGRLTRGCGADGGSSGAAAVDGPAQRGWVVKCNDAGVRMVDARVAATLDEWLATATGDEEMDLLYYEPMGPQPYIWSPFYVQLTEFADKSYALGLSCTHIHNDPTAAALFFHAWAAAHRRTTSPYPPFLHSPAFAVSPASPPPPPPLLAVKSSTAAPATDAAAMSSATFHFPASAVRALLSSLEHGTTPFAALAALFWLRVANAADGERELTLALDFRKRMHAPLPMAYFGSAVYVARARADLASGMPAVAAALDRHVAGVPEEELWAAVEWLHARQQQDGEPFQMYGPELTCMALDHVPMYGAEFEAGAPPVRVSCRVGGAAGEGLVIVLPAAEGGEARDVVVTLPAEATARICRDGEVLRHGAKVVFGPKVEKVA
ncbi:protein ECERIFERUM 26-like [Phragmites australis]|uniref:protein ECERIFERUM 26-like n=1 Tax=Phragmites australis TaxID=29695 RepID=UPI002D76D119|nr:protein ECERIFERUM 26-like [Phragmites australis]